MRDLVEFVDYYRELRRKKPRDEEFRNSIARDILKALRRNSLYLLVISGKQGVGKSVYALRVLDTLFSLVEPDEEWRDEIVLSHLFFDPLQAFQQLIQFKEQYPEVKIPVVVFDDAGVWFTSKMYWIDRRRYFMLYGLWQFARSHTCGMILTMPSLKLMPSELRASGFYNLTLTKSSGGAPWARLARMYLVTFSFDRWYYNLKKEIYINNIKIRDSLYKKYEPIRDSFVAEWENVLKEKIKSRLEEATALN